MMCEMGFANNLLSEILYSLYHDQQLMDNNIMFMLASYCIHSYRYNYSSIATPQCQRILTVS